MWNYIRTTGGSLDVVVAPPDVASVLRSPKMVWMAFAGYFQPPRDYLLATFRAMVRGGRAYTPPEAPPIP